MSLTLRAPTGATDTTLDISGADALAEGDLRDIGSETVLIRRAVTPALAYGEAARQLVTVFRGVDGTTKAAHAAGTSVAAHSGGGGGGVTVAIATLTDAQIRTLWTTPVEIIPAPGAGKWIVPILAVYRMDWTADYTNIDAACALDLAIGGSGLMNTVANSNLSGVSSLLAGGGPDGSWAVAGPKQPIAYSVPSNPHNHAINADSGWYDSDVENRPMRLTAVSQGSDFTGGDPANRLIVTVIYAVVAF